MTDDQLRQIIILTPAYSDDDNYAYQIRIARRVLAEANRLEMRRTRENDEAPQNETAFYLRAALDWIDAVPDDVAAALPAMPGFNRDDAENTLKS